MPAGPYSDQTQWLANKDQIILRQLDDATVVFHKTSGDTHVLNFLSLAIINILSNDAETFNSAAPKILLEIGMEQDDCPIQLIKDTFLQLDDVGLIVPRVADE